MIEERSVIAAGAQRPDAEIRTAARFFLVLRRATQQNARLLSLPYGNIFFGIGDVTGHRVYKLFQRMRAIRFQEAAPVAVSIDVDGAVLLQLIGVVLCPFGGAQQHGLFTVPGAINNGAFWLPPLLQQFSQAPLLL